MNQRIDRAAFPSIGALTRPDGGVLFRVWAPDHEAVAVVHDRERIAVAGWDRVSLRAEEDGYFSAVVPKARAGDRYWFQLDDGDRFPDPASRFQPEGPFGPSQVVDPSAFAWTDAGWTGPTQLGQVLYELHVGTFTEDGTWQAALAHLPRLADLGITLIEVLPVAEFAGMFNWGYDGVDLFAPSHTYGTPTDFRAFVNEAHRLGLGVLLDVVYNHLGPRGDFLGSYAGAYKSGRNQTEWGVGFDFDGPGSGPVRGFFLENVAYWIRDFHLDGFRLDAIQEYHDASAEHIATALVRRARAAAAPRSIVVIGENESQQAEMARPPEEGGFGLDGLWNEDFHHVAAGLLTKRVEAYYSDYHATPQEIVSLWKHGYLYQGQRNIRQGKPRGTSTRGLPPATFVNYLENHDQVANSLRGQRLHQLAHPALYRAITGLFLLAPGTPLIFQGQEFASTRPFHYFNDGSRDQEPSPRQSRGKFLAQFASLATAEAHGVILDPCDPATFQQSKLTDADRGARPEIVQLHRDLLHLRRGDPTFASQGGGGIDGAVLGPEALVLRHFGAEGDDRLIVANLGKDFLYAPISEPLLAPHGRAWRLLWSSERVEYGGDSTPEVITDDGWRLPRLSTIVFQARFEGEAQDHE